MYSARVVVGRYESDDTVEETCQYAQLVGDYLIKNLKNEADTTYMEIEVMVNKFKTVFSGALAEYTTIGSLSEKNLKENPSSNK